MANSEPDEEKVWGEVLRKMLPAGAPLPDEEQLDYSIAVEYDGPPLTYDVPRVDPVDIDSLSITTTVSDSELSSVQVVAPIERKARSPLNRIRNVHVFKESRASQVESERLSSDSGAQINGGRGSLEKESENGTQNCVDESFSLRSNSVQQPRFAAVLSFNTARHSEAEEDGYSSQQSCAEDAAESSDFAVAGKKRQEKKRGVCSRCGKGNRLKEKEVCLVCDSRYCSNCMLKAMGSMPEGRKCVSCIGQPIDESKRSSLGKCSRILSRVCSPLEVKQIMKAEKESAANQLGPEQVIVNGKQLRQEELAEILGCSLPPQKLKPGQYWYDKDSGLWGKVGEKPDRIISSKLNVGGKIRADASNGNTNVYINGREITKVELRVLKLANVQCPRDTHFWVYDDGSYEEEGQNNIKGNIWGKASTRFICSLLSLPVPPGNRNGSKDDQTTFSGRFVPEYLEQGFQRLLLFGSEGAGTSTIFKQAKFMYGNGFNSEELENIKLMIQSNVYKYLSILLEGRERFEEEALMEKKANTSEAEVSDQGETGVDESKQCIYLINQRLHHFSDWLLDIMAKGELDAYFPAAAREYAPIIDEIWKDLAIQETYKRREELQHLPDVAKYFLDRAVEISCNEYEPTEKDVVYAEGIAQSNGLAFIEFSFEDKNSTFETYQLIFINSKGLYDGCKWLEMFEDVRAVIFCVALSDYDQMWDCGDGAPQNKMLASRDMFESLVRHSSFRDAPFILLLNKYDIFEGKINQVPLSTCEWFKDFNPLKPQANAAYYYVAMKFKELYSSITGKKLFVWQTRAWERTSVDDAFKYAREVVKWEEEMDNNIYGINGDASFYSMELSSSPYIRQE
ncbi:extra-large guanine nucleotide-binding protein 3-like isoform X2 [Tripterygium wilfordii]|uniref:extra-large guanine nucleotide-binding protein 3-like isoform X2 n=1 Tax=Tripterygium wilfordii TaxID=458696 RepID=UPI0018F7F779|nr:extra-large guanine nucleotide-binding protein 3-like isoform X2 [Tripterygium wilfordii]